MVHRLACLLVLLVIIGMLPLLAQGQHSVQAQTDSRCFNETEYCISGRIREFWEQNGGLPVFGLPITPQIWQTIEGAPYQVQWFERNRLELHPENAPPFDVLLGRLSENVLEQQGRNWYTFEQAPAQDGCRTFETGHSVCGEFLEYWQNHGLSLDGQPGFNDNESLALLGMPLSTTQEEPISDGTETVMLTVQWFERARMELHPGNEPRVLLGLLGNVVYEHINARRIAFFSDRDGNTEIYSMGASGSVQFRLTNHPAPDEDPDWSLDGNRIAFDTYRDGNWEIYVINRDGSTPTNLTNNPATDAHPAWSPNSNRIAFDTNRDGNWEIYLMNGVDGFGETNLSNNAADDGYPAWSPDGTRLVFQSQRDGNWEIYLMNADGSGQTRLTNDSATDVRPAWSSDGTRIAFQSNRSGKDDIYVMNVDGSGSTNLTAGHPGNYRQPDWTADGQIVVQSDRDGNWEIYMLAADGSQLQNLTNMLNAADEYPVWWSK